jgi:single-strand DNA-binding protein
MIVVAGRLQMRNWTDKDGNKRKTAEIVADNVYFGESKKDKDARESGVTVNTYSNPYNVNPYNVNPYNITPTYGGYTVPNAPSSDFAMLDDDDAVLPF